MSIPPSEDIPNTSADWHARWQRQDAWTLREFAQLCCGWDPSVYEFPNRDAYNEAVESINRAVRVNVLRIAKLLWPPTGAERLYDNVPMFIPSQVAWWAARRYSKTFPFSAEDWAGTKPDAQGEAVAWANVTIDFISDHRLQISVKGRTYTLNFGEMGCEDARNETPNKAWQALRALAESNGVLTQALDGGDWAKTEKRMQELRKVLRRHFEQEGFQIASESDPLPYVKDIGYRATFSIRQRAAFDT